jgi:hypothetical protein
MNTSAFHIFSIKFPSNEFCLNYLISKKKIVKKNLPFLGVKTLFIKKKQDFLQTSVKYDIVLLN